MRLLTHKGFTTIEVLLALAVMASGLYILSQLQMRSLLRVSFSTNSIQHVFALKKEAYSIFLTLLDGKKEPKREVKKEDTATHTTITAGVYSLGKKHPFSSCGNLIKCVKAKAVFTKQDVKETEEIITFAFVPPSSGEQT